MKSQKIWDFWAQKYEKLWVQKYSLGPTREMVVEEVKRLLPQYETPCRILDAGCATGQLLRLLQSQTPIGAVNCRGIDLSPAMIKIAAAKDPQSTYGAVDISNFDDEENSWDLIICTHSFPYYPKKKSVLKKFAKVLTPGGRLIIVQASENNLWDKFAMKIVKLTTSKAWYPPLYKMLKLLEPEFEIDRIQLLKEKFYMASIFMYVAQNRKE